METRVDIQTADGTADCFLFQPETGGPFPAIIYLPDIRGVRAVFMEMARKVAAQGYAVLMPNLFYRLSPSPVIDPDIAWFSEPCMKRFGELVSVITPDGLASDHRAFLEYLKAAPGVAPGKVAIAGYCMGGTVGFRIAGDFPEDIAMAASFHGGRLASDAPDSPHLKAADITALLYFGHAADDQSMTPAMIAQLEGALAAADVPHVTDHYAAKHGYAVADNPAHDAKAEALHWTRLFEMLGKAFPRS